MNIAILGAGRIARKMAETVNGMQDVNLYAIASRDIKKSEEFAKEFEVLHAFGSYEEMLKDLNIDLVYIATPHSHHYEHSMLCLEYNKNVLCEKPFTANAKQAKLLFEYAKKKNCFITEAIWSRYLPMAKTIRELVINQEIGEVYSLSADFGARNFQAPRLSQPELAGGALLDLGIYTLTFAAIAFGLDIAEVSTAAIKNEHGVDAQHSIILRYQNNRMATLRSSMMNKMESRAVVYGSEGYFVVNQMTNYESIEVYNNQFELKRKIEQPAQITGFEYEVRAAMEAIKEGKLECLEMPHIETIRMMELMDQLRAVWGVSYPFD